MGFFVFETDQAARKRVRQTLASLLYFAIDKLNGKGKCDKQCASAVLYSNRDLQLFLPIL